MDKYDEAIAYLTENPEQIHPHWNVAGSESEPIGSVLFRSASPSGRYDAPTLDGANWCGCLTQVRVGLYSAYTPELTEEIRKDERIPVEGMDIEPEHLPVFAEWQRRLDVIFNRN